MCFSCIVALDVARLQSKDYVTINLADEVLMYF